MKLLMDEPVILVAILSWIAGAAYFARQMFCRDSLDEGLSRD